MQGKSSTARATWLKVTCHKRDSRRCILLYLMDFWVEAVSYTCHYRGAMKGGWHSFLSQVCHISTSKQKGKHYKHLSVPVQTTNVHSQQTFKQFFPLKKKCDLGIRIAPTQPFRAAIGAESRVCYPSILVNVNNNNNDLICKAHIPITTNAHSAKNVAFTCNSFKF
jgi:hypothetical protein